MQPKSRVVDSSITMKKRDDQLLLIKAHYFLFFSALGPILPFLNVIGKQLGISKTAMGLILMLVPVLYFIMKPMYGFCIDRFAKQRTFVFTLTVALMGSFYLLIYFVPHIPLLRRNLTSNVSCSSVLFCDLHKSDSPNWTVNQVCDLSCQNGVQETAVELRLLPDHCKAVNDINAHCNVSQASCSLNCSYVKPVSFVPLEMLWENTPFWLFVLLLALGSTAFNVVSSASDAICFNILGEGNESEYGVHRLWGTAGYGITAFLAGYCIDHLSKGATVKNNTPSFVLLMFFISLDIIVCSRLKFPSFPQRQITREAFSTLKQPRVMIFVFFAFIIGLCDGFLVYYLFWFMEEVAEEVNNYGEIRFIEGLTVLLQSLGSEMITFFLSGKILAKLGCNYSLALCLMFFSIRMYVLSFITNPWWALPIECLLHGPTYAFSYVTMVSYVSQISNPAIQGTMQGLVSGIYDGIGYAVASFLGGYLSSIFPLRDVFRIFGSLALTASILQYFLFIFYLRREGTKNKETSVCHEHDESEIVLSPIG